MSKLQLEGDDPKNHEVLSHTMEKSAIRNSYLRTAAIEAAKKHRKLEGLCANWVRDNHLKVFLKLRTDVGFTEPYRPRPDRRGKTVQRHHPEEFYGP